MLEVTDYTPVPNVIALSDETLFILSSVPEEAVPEAAGIENCRAPEGTGSSGLRKALLIVCIAQPPNWF